MITKEQWKSLKGSKKAISEKTNEEIQKYLEEGGVITRREKGGTFTYWEADENGKLQELK